MFLSRLCFYMLTVIGSCTLSLFAQSIYTSNVRFSSWDVRPAQIDTFDVHMTVDGAISRTTLTMTIRDNGAGTLQDSLEIYAQLSLPPGAVVDSLKLWVGDTIMDGMIMDRRRAESIYESIVQRRRDPAILTQDYPTAPYELQIFPVLPGQARKVRISYTSLAVITADHFSFQLPMTIASTTNAPARCVTGSIHFVDTAIGDIKASGLPGLALSLHQSATTQFLWNATNYTAQENGIISFRPERYATSGVWVRSSSSLSGDPVFITIIHPGRFCGATATTDTATSLFFYPSSFTVEGTGNGFAYDLFGEPQVRIPANTPIVITGKLHNTTTLSMEFHGILNEREYSVNRYRSTPLNASIPLTGIWGKQYVQSLNAAYLWNDALSAALSLHILTENTALFAPEPGLDTSAYVNGEDMVTTQTTKNTTTTTIPSSLTLACERAGASLIFTFTGNRQTARASLRIYDLAGNLIADLTQSLNGESGKITWTPVAHLARGMYMARFCSGSEVRTIKVRLNR